MALAPEVTALSPLEIALEMALSVILAPNVAVKLLRLMAASFLPTAVPMALAPEWAAPLPVAVAWDQP
jgi:hypothetical protein